jgi:hypothetical protein
MSRLLPFASSCLLAACSISIHPHSAWNQRSCSGLVAHTGVERIELDCPREADTLAARVKVHGKGEVHARLLDPAGRVCVDEMLRSGDRDGTSQWQARPGRWVCELGFSGFTGDCAVELTAHDEPAVHLRVEVTGVEAGR